MEHRLQSLAEEDDVDYLATVQRAYLMGTYTVQLAKMTGEKKVLFSDDDSEKASVFYGSYRKKLGRGESLYVYKGDVLLRSVIPPGFRNNKVRTAPTGVFK